MFPNCYCRMCDVDDWIEDLEEGSQVLAKLKSRDQDTNLEVKLQRHLRRLLVVLNKINDFSREVVYRDEGRLKLVSGPCPIKSFFAVDSECPVSEFVLSIRQRVDAKHLAALYEIVSQVHRDSDYIQKMPPERWALAGGTLTAVLRLIRGED